MKRRVFKIQRPLMGDPMYLVYDKQREYMAQLPYPDENLQNIFEGGIQESVDGMPLKVYVEGFVDKNKKLNIEKVLSWDNDKNHGF